MRDTTTVVSTRMETARLALRPLEAGDIDAFHALMAEARVCRFLHDGRTPSPADSETMLHASQALLDESRTGLWGVRVRGDARLAGFIGLWPFGTPPVQELSFALRESARGRGFATEAGDAMLDYVRDALGWPAVQASCDLGNNTSIRTLWRLKFAEFAIRSGPSGPLRVFRRAL